MTPARKTATAACSRQAHVWRGFSPAHDTDRGQLRRVIVETLNRLALRCGAADETAAEFIVSYWPFPLWPLTMKEPRSDDGGLDGLRKERERTIEWIERTEAERDPAPAISRSKVEEMSDAYAAWECDIEAHTAHSIGTNSRDLRVRRSRDAEGDFELPSYGRIRDMHDALNEEERAALVALGWFARERIADWPRNYQRAKDLTPTLDQVYQIGLGHHWRHGLDRWDAKARPFEPGQWYLADHS